ncbi:hypothetical protein [Sphingomonas sp. LaA6.9]|uniref:hypothetical protein n=1 Tax=Sphingomonas sp. LaA6.9 TaxID=2919914 RepID=UPI001F502B70|nr:hypothetical protein [Sphingomonas sp. LaA6.9]MCJ8158677.1 hypothetical protein [Sphingomonas sp. LaA6.9]
MMMTQIDQLSTSLCAAVAEEIRGVRAMIEQLAETLVADERFATDYLDQLQAFDLVIQQADESADLLDRVAQGQDIHDAIARVRLTVIQERLRAAIG